MSIAETPRTGLAERILGYFPERQVYFRANGIVRFIQFGTKTQLAAAGALALVFLWFAVVSVHFLSRDMVLESREQTIADMTAEQEQLNTDMGELQRDVVARAERLEQRQQYLDALVADDPSADVDTTDSGTGEAQDAAEDDRGAFAAPAEPHQQASRGFSSLFQSAQAARVNSGITDFRAAILQRLNNIERQQIRRAAGLTSHARKRLASLDQIISPTGLASADLIAEWQGRPDATNFSLGNNLGTGGPLIPDPMFGDNAENFLSEIDVGGHFTTLDDAWSELLKAYDVLDSLPLEQPASKYYLSSHYGRRIDPFKKSRAMHSGLDLAGWPGTDITAGAGGVVVKAGTWGAYGKMVEIDHGNGFRTRYGHLRKVKVKRGQVIEPGQQIGEMGCSGRCTSTHLHYEVWFGDKPRNPLPFIKVADNVFEIQQRRNAKSGAGEK